MRDRAGVVFGVLAPFGALICDGIATRRWGPVVVAMVVGGGLCAPAALAAMSAFSRRMLLLIGSSIVGGVVGAPVLPVGIAAGFAFGWIGAMLLRDAPMASPTMTDPTVRDVVGLSWTSVAVLGAIPVGAMVGLFPRLGWAYAAAGVALVAVVASLTRFTVSAAASGMRVRTCLGMPVFEVASDDVAAVTVTGVAPYRDSGWGVRARPSEFALITRTGPAVRIETESGRTLTVATARAAEMVAALRR
jgi:hypothetical protein